MRRVPVRQPWLRLLGLALIVIVLAYQAPRVLQVDVGAAGDGGYVQGFYFAENQGDASVRWSGPSGQVDFPGAGIRPWTLRLRANALRAAQVAVTVNGRPLGQIELGGAMGEYSLPVAAGQVAPWGDLRVGLSTEPFQVPPDQRQLGIMVDWVRLEPAGLAPVLPPPGTLAGLLLCILLGYLVAARLGLTAAVRLGAGFGLSLAGAIAVVAARPLVALHVPWALLALAVLWVCAPSLRRAPWWHWLLFLGLCASGYRFAARAVEFYNTGLPPGDFTIYFDAARNVRLGLPLYDFAAAIGMPNGPVYKYPPLYAVLLAPATVFPVRDVAAGWYLLNLGLLGLIFWLIVRYVLPGPDDEGGNHSQRRLPSPALVYLLGIGFLNFQPAWESLIRGQIDVIILAAVVLALVLTQRRRAEPVAGIGLALVTMFKVYPGLVLAYLLWRRRWKAVAGFAIAFGVFLLLSGVVAGWDTLWRYVSEVLTVQTAAVPYPENQSFDGFLGRIVIPGAATTWYTTIPFPRWTLLVLYLLDLATAAATFAFTWTGYASTRRYQLGFAIAMPVIVLLWPTAWIHYQTLLLLPFAFLLALLWHGEMRPWFAVPLLLSFLLVAIGNEYLVLRPELQEGWLRLAQSFKLYGVLLLWLLLLGAGRTLGRRPAPVVLGRGRLRTASPAEL